VSFAEAMRMIAGAAVTRMKRRRQRRLGGNRRRALAAETLQACEPSAAGGIQARR